MVVFFFLAILLSGLAVIAGIILSISGMASDRSGLRNGGFITFGISIIALICSIYFAVSGAVNAVKENVINPMSNLMDSAYVNQNNMEEDGLMSDNRSYLLEDTCSNQAIKYIKEQSAKTSVAIPNSFYSYFGEQGFSRMPLIYPFAIHCMESKDRGTLVNEGKVVDIKTTPGGEENLTFNVSALNYDENMILMRVTTFQAQTNRDVYIYMLYSVAEKKNKEYKSEAELFKAATKAGFKGEKVLISLWDYDGMF